MNDDDLPLYRRFPALREIPRVRLCRLPSPVERLSPDLWIKRDDRNSDVCGGNKTRALEFLLGNVRRGDTILTVGGAGSTHVLTTMVHGARIGANVLAERWRHDMNLTALDVSSAIAERHGARVRGNVVIALTRAQVIRIRRRVHYIPTGGTTPLGMLGHVNAALELVEQIGAGDVPAPAQIVVPCGSGGTVAGLALGFAIAGFDVPVVAARVTPRLAASRMRLRRLMAKTTALISGYTAERVRLAAKPQIRIVHDVYGGAYGRPLPAAAPLTEWLREQTGIALDGTYTGKAFVAADAAARDAHPTLFWLTFDARCIHPEGN